MRVSALADKIIGTGPPAKQNRCNCLNLFRQSRGHSLVLWGDAVHWIWLQFGQIHWNVAQCLGLQAEGFAV
jgi:hypothetical protein